MKKRMIFLMLFVFALSCTLWTGGYKVQAASYSGKSGSLSWTIDESGKLTISGTGNYNSEDKGWSNYRMYVNSIVVNVTGITNTSYMFSGWDGGFPNAKTINLENLDTSKVTNMSGMFDGCSAVTELNLSKFNTSNVTDMSYMFASCTNLEKITFGSSFNTGSVADMSYMFGYCNNLRILDLSNFNTVNVTNMSGMFLDCSSLTEVNLSKFSTGKVKDMSDMFGGCSGLNKLDLSNFDTRNVTNMAHMFSSVDFDNNVIGGCSGLTELNVSSFNTNNVTDMNGMFGGCNGLSKLDLSNFNTRKVTDMGQMFAECSGLTTLNLSSFNTENVTSMGMMFRGCSRLTELDLSSFDMNSEVYLGEMFDDCRGLVWITAPRNVPAIISLPEVSGYVWKNPQGKIVEDVEPGLSSSVVYTRVAASSGTQGENPSGGGQSTTQTTQPTLPKVGSKHTVSNGIYKVTKSSASSKTVTLTKLKNTKKTSFTIPATVKISGNTYKVTEISAKAFKGNKKLKSVTIGKNVKKIGKEAFSGCKKLNKITIKSTVLKSVGNNAIKGINNKAAIKVPKKQLAKYKKLFKSKTGFKKTMKIKK